MGSGGGGSVKNFDPYAGTGIRQLYTALGNYVKPYIGQPGPVYQGERVAEPSYLQEMGFNMAGAIPENDPYSSQIDPNAIGRYLGQAGDLLNDVTGDWDGVAETQYWQNAMVKPAMRMFQQDIIPQIKESFASGGISSGGLNRSLGRAGSDLGSQLSGQLAQLLYSGQQANLGRKQTGVGQAAQLSQLPLSLAQGATQLKGANLDIASILANLGVMERGLRTEEIGGERQTWEEGQPWNNPILNKFLGLSLQQPSYTPVVQQGSPSLASQILPALGGFAGQMGGGGGTSGGGFNLGGLLGTATGGIGSLLGGLAGLIF